VKRNKKQKRKGGFWRSTLVALVSGIGLAFSIPPWGLWVLAFPSAALLWWVLGWSAKATGNTQSTGNQVSFNDGPWLKRRIWIGWVAGIGLYGPGLFWVTTFNVYGGIVLIVVEALALGFGCGACRTGRGRLLSLPGAMVLAEWIRDIWPFGGLPLGSVALGQVSGPLADAARIGGPLLLIGMIWLGGAGLGSILVGIRCKERRKFGPHIAGGLAILVVIVLGVFGAVGPDGGPALKKIRVASVQGGGVRGLSKAQVSPTTVYDAQLDASKMLGSSNGFGPSEQKALVVWPEDVVSLVGYLAGTAQQQQLSQLSRRLHASLLAGVTENVSPDAFRNEVVAFSPSGSVVGDYEKVHRVPFGEYVPLRGFFKHLANLSAVPQDAIPGNSPGYIDTPTAPVGLMISYEVFFAVAGRAATRAGAQILLVPTNTSSYSTSQVPTQEIAAARLQAIEEGRDLIQSAPTGYSALITNTGKVLSRSALGSRQVLVGTLSLREGSTIYERFGDLPVLILALLALVVGWFIDLSDRRRSTSVDSVAS
jgi:apolipoprotein N-acyltransferase